MTAALDGQPLAGDVGMPGVWWCWLCNTRACAVPWGPSSAELVAEHHRTEHPRTPPEPFPEEWNIVSSAPLHPERREYFDRDPDPAGLPAAQIAVEHLTHHGQQLRWDGSSHTGGLEDAYHRFVCADPDCFFRVTIMVHEVPQTPEWHTPRTSIESAGHQPPNESAHFGTVHNHFCVLCGARVSGPHAVDPPTDTEPKPAEPEPTPEPPAAPTPAKPAGATATRKRAAPRKATPRA